jgi:hypothetical protein
MLDYCQAFEMEDNSTGNDARHESCLVLDASQKGYPSYSGSSLFPAGTFSVSFTAIM